MSFPSWRDPVAYVILPVRCLAGIMRLNRPQTEPVTPPLLFPSSVNGSNEASSCSSWKPASRAGFVICQIPCRMKVGSPSWEQGGPSFLPLGLIPCPGLPGRAGTPQAGFCAQYLDPGWPRALHRGHRQPRVGTAVAPVMHPCSRPCLPWILDSCFPHLPHSLCHWDL